MQWTAIVAAVSGAVIALTSTLIADRARWRRDLLERDRDALRLCYAQFLEALTQARDVITQVSRRPDLSPQERSESVREVIGTHGVYARQYELELTAPASVARLANEAAQKLARYRDTVQQGQLREEAACTLARRDFRAVRQALIDGMRHTLQRP